MTRIGIREAKYGPQTEHRGRVKCHVRGLLSGINSYGGQYRPTDPMLLLLSHRASSPSLLALPLHYLAIISATILIQRQCAHDRFPLIPEHKYAMTSRSNPTFLAPSLLTTSYIT